VYEQCNYNTINKSGEWRMANRKREGEEETTRRRERRKKGMAKRNERTYLEESNLIC
jgi:hypothetical protein